jgi:ATP-dependent Clp protease ATP-binding subunit ClpA
MEVDGNFLKAGAETATKTTMVIRHALGGVLFVDEAYALVQGDAYGQDAIATLIKQMEDLRGRFVLIIAGYTDEMRDLLNANPGFQSRLKEYLYFESYNDEDMLTIFKTMAKSRGYEISSQAIEPFTQRVQAERALPSFGNARTARSILDEAIEKHAYRCIKQQLPQDQRYLIDAPDINPKPNAI